MFRISKSKFVKISKNIFRIEQIWSDSSELETHLLSLVTPLAGKADHGVGTDSDSSVLVRFVLGRGCEPDYQPVVNVSPQFELGLPLFYRYCTGAQD